jgi:DNA-binding response OmpR family regulator
MGGEKIIIASPCDAERKLLGHLLLGDGLDVIEVASGNEVIEQTQKGDVSLIVLDTLAWETPALNTLRAIKTHDRVRETPVMLFGQPSSREDVVAAVKGGAATWVARKGFQIETFIEKVRELAQAGSRARSGSPATIRIPKTTVQPLSPHHVQEVLDRISDLAAFDFTISEAITTSCSKDRLVDHMAHIVGRDPMLAIALLSHAGGLGHGELADGTSELRETVRFIGDRVFTRLAESLPSLKSDKADLWDSGHFWLHSVAVSRLAGLFSEMLGTGRPAETANAGLLHDIGSYLLAQSFPHHFEALFNSANSRDCVTAEWEAETIGMHHGAVGALALKRFGLSESLQDAAFAHELDPRVCQSLKASSRVLTMVVQAADQMAVALFPGDPVLEPLTPITPEFEAAMTSAGVLPSELIGRSHAIVADLVTEMRWLFPQSETRPHHYLEPPIKEALYYAPGRRHLDSVKVFFETRCEELRMLRSKKEAAVASDTPLIVNLLYVTDGSAQIEVMTSLMAMGLLKDRRAVVLLDSPPKDSYLDLLPETCRLQPARSQPARWLHWLAGRSAQVSPGEQTLSVA